MKKKFRIGFFSEKGIQVDVRRLSPYLYWINPLSQNDFSLLIKMDTVLKDSPVRRMDRWMEVLGAQLQPSVIRLECIPLHAWDESVFKCLGDCLRVVMEIDDAAKQKKRIDKVHLLILRNPNLRLPKSLPLDVGVRFSVSISEEDDCRGVIGISSSENCRESFSLPEGGLVTIAEQGFVGEIAGIKSPNPNQGEDFVGALVPALAVAHKRKGVEESRHRGRDCSSMEHLQQFRRTPGNKRFSSCPSIKGVFG